MTSQSALLQPIEAIVQELSNVLENFNQSTPVSKSEDSIVVTSSGREYKVAFIGNRPGIWFIPQTIGTNAPYCQECTSKKKYAPSSSFYRIMHNETSTIIPDKLIHSFLEHPGTIPKDLVDDISLVLLN